MVALRLFKITRRCSLNNLAVLLITVACVVTVVKHYRSQLRHQYRFKIEQMKEFWSFFDNNHAAELEAAIGVCKLRLVEEGLRKPAKMYTRRFDDSTPVRIYGAGGTSGPINVTCPIGCIHQADQVIVKIRPNEPPDATFEKLDASRRFFTGIFSIYRTMESVTNVPLSDFETAQKYYDIVMTPNLRSHVPVPYFSWVQHGFMKPLPEKRFADLKTDQSIPILASAFISNCQATNFRLQAIAAFQSHFGQNFAFEYRGKCAPDPMFKNGTLYKSRTGSKDEIMRRYKFHFAFENSIEEDYVTEKFFEPLIEGSVPVVIGAPNIEQFAPQKGSYLAIHHLKDVADVGREMLRLNADSKAYDAFWAWKNSGPSDSFKALVDLAVTHSSCRVCIHVADRLRDREDCRLFQCFAKPQSDKLWLAMLTSPRNSTEFLELQEPEPDHKAPKETRFCSCSISTAAEPFDVVVLQVRERGNFDFYEIFLQTRQLTVNALAASILEVFEAQRPFYRPIWTKERDLLARQLEKLPKRDRTAFEARRIELKIYRIYPVGVSQRAALFEGVALDSDEKVSNFVKHRPCGKLEVIFV